MAYRLLGNAHEDVLTAFEATMKTVYHFGKLSRNEAIAKPVGNDFQNIERGRRRYEELSLNPFLTLNEKELTTLGLNIQKRHIIGHNLSVVDSKFAEHIEESKIGETVSLVADDIREFAVVCQKVIDGLDEWLVGIPSPGIGRRLAPLLQAEPAVKKVVSLEALDINLSMLARQIALLLASSSKSGIGGATIIDGDKIKASMADASVRDITLAIAELEREGYVTTAGGISREVPLVFATTDLFATFDPVAVGTSPISDAAVLIERLLSEAVVSDLTNYTVGSAALQEKTDWELRRFNPALAIVASAIDDRRVSRTLDGQYFARSFIVTPADELALKELLDRIKT